MNGTHIKRGGAALGRALDEVHARRSSGWLLMIALLLCMLASPLQADAADRADVTFRAAGLPGATDTSVYSQSQRAVLREFGRLNPHIHIQRFTMPKIEGGGMDAGPLMAIAAGMPPHAIYVNFRQSATYINRGFLTPLEILLARIQSDNEDVRKVDSAGQWVADPTPEEIQAALEAILDRVPEPVHPVMYRQADREGVGTGKHVWAIPQSTLVKALLYRRDLFHEAGLDPDRPPQNWEELRYYAQRLRNPQRRQYGLMVHGGEIVSYGIYNLLVSYGVRAMEQDEDGNWYASFNTPEAAETIMYVWELVNGEFERDGQVLSSALHIEASSPTYGMMWARGQVGMVFEYLDQDLMTTINPQLVGLAPVPASPAGTAGAEINARMLGVFADSTPQQQLAIMQYIWFLTGEDAKRIQTRVFVESGYGQFVNPDLLEQFGYDDLLARVPEGWRETFHAAMAHGVPEPYGRNTQHIYREMSKPIEWAMAEDLGGITREGALARIQVQLDEAAAHVDRYFLGEIDPAEMAQRRLVGGFVMLVIVLLFTVSLVGVWRSFTKAATIGGEKVPLRRFFWGYVLLAPALTIILSWEYLPLTGGAVLALFDYELVVSSTFVGVGNFATILFDQGFWWSLGRTFYFVALVIGLGFWPPILLAILLDEVPTETFKYVFRTVFYLPQIVSGVIMIFLWRQLYDPEPTGFLNQIILSLNYLGPISATLFKWVLFGLWASFIGLLIWLPIRMSEISPGVKAALGTAATALIIATIYPLISAYMGPSDVALEAIAARGGDPEAHFGISAVLATLANLWGRFDLEAFGFIRSPQMAMLCAVVPMVWATAGPGCIIYLAAMKTIPRDLYEAAAIDGAGVWHRICYIILPRLKFLIVIQFIAAVVGAFKGGTDFILALTGGGPQEATMILPLRIFSRTFMDLEFGLGAAMAWFLGGMLIVFTAYQLRMLSRAEFRAAGSKTTDDKP